jgi:DNA-directed RNA polymerase specialized sigma24 family protein
VQGNTIPEETPIVVSYDRRFLHFPPIFAPMKTLVQTTKPDADSIDLLTQAVSRLPPQQKKAWKLICHRKFTLIRAAKQMEIDRSTIKSHMRAALSRLSKDLKDHIDPDQLADLLSLMTVHFEKPI